MLEKNKDYVEFTLQCTSVEYGKTKDYRTVCFDGYSDSNFPGVPMDVVCKEFDHKVIVVGKRDFERLQAANERLRTENEQLKKKLEEFSPVSANGWLAAASFWKKTYEALFKLVGFSSVEEIEDYLTNEVECDTLHEAILKLIDENKYACEEWCSANSSNNSWKAVTGYSTPEDYMHARISGAFHTPFDYTATWQKATGCDSPCDAEKRIKALNERIDESEACYNHLLALTGFGSEGEIEDALDQCDHSTLRKALVDYEFDYEELLKLTGYKSNQDIRVALNYSEQFVYETMRELINSLKRKAKFTESGWKEATGCDSPEAAETTLRNLRGRIDEIKTFAAIASNWTDRIVEG